MVMEAVSYFREVVKREESNPAARSEQESDRPETKTNIYTFLLMIHDDAQDANRPWSVHMYTVCI